MSKERPLELDLAVARGFVSPEKAEQARSAHDPLAWLAEKKAITPEQIREIRAATEKLADAQGTTAILVRKGLLLAEDGRRIQERQRESLLKGKIVGVKEAADELRITIDENAVRDVEAPPEVPKSLGPYDILRPVGRGGMGVVYAARDARLGRDVAIKILKGRFDLEELQRFYREERALAKLEHPAIVRLYDVGQDQGQPYFVMELVDGHTLLDAMLQRNLKRKDAIDLLRQAAEALDYAHRAGVVHRDLKPNNILVTPAGQVKLMDFGLARLSEGQDQQGLTMSGIALGTPAYMSPEQARGAWKEIDARTDIWGLGATLYELLTGCLPFSGPNVAETLRKVISAQPIPPRVLDPSIPPDLDAICLKALEKDPKRRYATAGEFADDLARSLTGDRTRARPIGTARRVFLFLRRHPLLAGALLGVFLAGAALLAVDRIVDSRVDRLTEVRITDERKILDQEMTRLGLDLRSAAATLADSPQVRACFEEERSFGEAGQIALYEIEKNQTVVELLLIADDAGAVISRHLKPAGERPFQGKAPNLRSMDILTTTPAERRMLERLRRSEELQAEERLFLVEGRLFHASAHPILDGRRFVGMLLVGREIDDAAAARIQAMQSEGGSAAFLVGDRFAAASVPVAERGEAQSALLGRIPAPPAGFDARLNGRSYRVVAVPLPSEEAPGHVQAVLYVSLENVPGYRTRLILRLAAIAAGVAFLFLAYALFSRK